MDEFNNEKAKRATIEEIAVYGKLKQLKSTEGFADYLDFLAKAAAVQMMQPYLGSKIPSHDDFAGAWGEVRGKLYILQELGGAELIEKHLIEQLKLFNNPES